MNMEIKFKGLPFVPEKGQIIYYEEKRDSKANKFIRNNYDWLVALFAKHDLEFCYMPIKAKELISYYAPNASEEEIAANMQPLSTYAVNPSLDGPALVFALDIPVKDDDGNTVLQCVPIVTTWYKSTKSTFKDLVLEIKSLESDRSIYYHRLEEEKRNKNRRIRYCRLGSSEDEEYKYPVRYSIADSDDATRESRKSEGGSATDSIKFAIAKREEKPSSGTKFAIMDEPDEPATGFGEFLYSRVTEEDSILYENTPSDSSIKYSRKRPLESNYSRADEKFDTDAQVLIDEIKARIKALQMRGINMVVLHELLNVEIKLSRLRITKDKRIIMVDYSNREIKMTALVKAVFLLFLKHPEGIRFKELSDYYSELFRIYQSLNPRGSLEKQQNSIKEITNPFSNSINEKCARIREAFLGSFDERLSKNYFVTGERGEAKRITLDRNLVIWEE